MNKFLTYAGTQPVYLGDIDFMQNAVRDGFRDIARALMDLTSDTPNAILQGLEKSTRVGAGEYYSSGIVVINGELYEVPSHSITAEESGQDFYLHLNSVLSSSRTFGDGTSHYCHDTRTGYLSIESSGGILLSSLPRLHEKEISDDVVYDSYEASGKIISGRLIRKSGLWFCDVAFQILETMSDSDLGAVSFQNLRPAHYNSFGVLTFPERLLLYYNESYDSYNIVCTTARFSPSDHKVSISFQFEDSSLIDHFGNGHLRCLIPIF